MTNIPSSFPGERAVAAARSNLVMSPISIGIGLAATVVVARVLTVEQFALYAAILALRRTIQFFTDLGTGAASTRIFAELQHAGAKRQARRLYYRIVLLRVLLLLAIGGAMLARPGTFTRVLGLDQDESYLLSYIIVIGIAEAASVFASYVLFGTFSQSILNRVLIAQSAVQATLVIIAALFGRGLGGIVAALVTASLFKGVALNLAALRVISKTEERQSEVGPVARSYARVAASAFFAKFATWVHTRDVVSLFAISAGSRTQLANFALGYDFAYQALTAVVAPTRGLILPAFALIGRSTAAQRQLFRQATRGAGLLVFPTAAALAATSDSAVAVFFGDKYNDAAPYLLLVTCGVAVELVLSIPATSLMLADDRLLTSYRWVQVVVASLGAFYLLTPYLNLFVIAGFLVSVRVAAAMTLHVYIYVHARISTDLGWLVRALGAGTVAGACGAGVALLVSGQVLDLIIVPIVCLALWSILVREFGIFLPRDAEVARRILPIGAPIFDVLSRKASDVHRLPP
jgi:O-antigen/teichoic acid export membrane protein